MLELSDEPEMSAHRLTVVAAVSSDGPLNAAVRMCVLSHKP
jgi:hypothetical protein